MVSSNMSDAAAAAAATATSAAPSARLNHHGSESTALKGKSMTLPEGPGNSFRSLPDDRNLTAHLETVANFRDICRVATLIKPYCIFRSSTPSQATQKDAALLMEQVGIKTIIDFREQSESLRDCGACLLREQYPEFDLESQPGDKCKEIMRRMEKIPITTFAAQDIRQATSPSIPRRPSAIERDRERRARAQQSTSSDSSTEPSRPTFRLDASVMVDEVFDSHDAASTPHATQTDKATPTASQKEPATGAGDNNTLDAEDIEVVTLPGQRRLVRVPYCPRKVMKKVVFGMLNNKDLGKVACWMFLGGLFFRKKWRERGKSVAKRRFNKVGLLGFYKVLMTRSYAAICSVLQICADARNHPIMLHCSHGKDRTGVTTAVLLAALGVSDEAIAADYALSDDYGNSPEGRQRFDTECPELDPDEWARARPETMLQLMQWVREEFGGIDGYLDLIGFDGHWRHKLRQNLLVNAGSMTSMSDLGESKMLLH
ncbi:uncharacterized protein MONBRDRAFT_30841 [Monosiga brevicollis MX1]|uniref:Tyrosine specific protein phosphatases domain-containing protein n=1 Tax=Monosiga brevicollis TaxID=81824 RepID=A9UPM0_MONBE|nr:uncharacterized protein MONBRDRAFT_30841 [Monosiga brevicollis MX1]EDQ92894.1 predicted protein [Monosiga brevicollis MX1]|eukprot:XP_001742656.1 hypothetical protein [Monosiga brevicollis MX1]